MYVVPLGYKLPAAGGHGARNTNAENIMVFCIGRAALRVASGHVKPTIVAAPELSSQSFERLRSEILRAESYCAFVHVLYLTMFLV